MKTVCECFKEPQGKHGLEGYYFGGLYYYQHEAEDMFGNPYYRVYPKGDMNTDRSFYETCSERDFNKYFRRVT